MGTLGIFLFSHCLIYYLWLANAFHAGEAFVPGSLDWDRIWEKSMPTMRSMIMYLGFVLWTALPWPGIDVPGTPMRDGSQLNYRCNGLCCWYATIALVATAQWTDFYPLENLVDDYAPLLTTAVLFGNGLAAASLLSSVWCETMNRPTGNVWFDYFFGANLNPRLGRLDIKMWAEIRVSWILLFLLTLSAACRFVALHGYLSWNMAGMVLAHFLYTNSCHKGEQYIPTTWDITYENFGWYLSFWNCAGVPFVYSFNSFYLLWNHHRHHSSLHGVLTYNTPWWNVFSIEATVHPPNDVWWLGGSEPFGFWHAAWLAFILTSFYVWDTTNSQKNHFRSPQPKRAWGFPQFDYGRLLNPDSLEVGGGRLLLVDGWYAYARKIHYTADIGMAVAWALTCGFDSWLPWFYPIFFVLMISHRYGRDQKRMREKYGRGWKRYCERVPYIFIPYVY